MTRQVCQEDAHGKISCRPAIRSDVLSEFSEQTLTALARDIRNHGDLALESIEFQHLLVDVGRFQLEERVDVSNFFLWQQMSTNQKMWIAKEKTLS